MSSTKMYRLMARLTLIALLTLLSLTTGSCILFDEYPTCPTVFEGEDARSKFESLRKSFSVTDVKFFNDKLYITTSSATLEFDGERIDRIYKCRRGDWDVSEVVGLDNTTNNLWFYNHRDLLLLQFDGSNWNSHKLPSLPKPEYYTRGDVNVGFDGFDLNGEFLLLNIHRSSRPNSRRSWTIKENGSWEPFPISMSANCSFDNPKRIAENGCWKKIGRINDELCAVLNGSYKGEKFANRDSIRDEHIPETDIIACRSGDSWKVVNPKGTPEFFSDKVASGQNAMFTSTRTGKIFRVTSTGPESIPSLGEVVALTVSSTGNLIVWFKDQGIYQYTDQWNKLYDVPFEPGSNLEGRLVEENSGVVVIVASPPFDMDKRPPPYQAWIMKDGKVVQIL